VEKNRFREDLFFRLNVLAITVPPLRERADDISELATHFSHELADELGVSPIPLNHQDLQKLKAYPWPGNVRELRNVIERSLLLGKLPGEFFSPDARAAAGGAAVSNPGMPLDWSMEDVEKHHMLRVLDSLNGNKTRAAKSLGVSRKTLERKLKAWKQET
jgi:DNA-binding NtrC family response regulator